MHGLIFFKPAWLLRLQTLLISLLKCWISSATADISSTVDVMYIVLKVWMSTLGKICNNKLVEDD